MSSFRPPSGFDRIMPVVKNLIIINAILFIATFILDRNGGINGQSLNEILGLHYWRSPDFRPWQPVTYMFMHAGFGHILLNMLPLWMFGTLLEHRMTSRRFLLFYLICGFGAGLCQTAVQAIQLQMDPGTLDAVNMVTTVGASGAIFGLLFAFGYLYPDDEVYVYFAIPLKAKWFVVIYAALELFYGLRNASDDNVAHFAHLGGMIFAFALLKIWRFPYGGNRWRRY